MKRELTLLVITFHASLSVHSDCGRSSSLQGYPFGRKVATGRIISSIDAPPCCSVSR